MNYQNLLLFVKVQIQLNRGTSLPASESKVSLNEMEKMILGSLLAFGVRSPKAMSWLLSEGHQLLGLETGIQESEINHHVSNLMGKGLIVHYS